MIDTTIVACYADGGVIGPNPSRLGGTFAYCHVNASDHRIREASGIVTLEQSWQQAGVTNNLTELVALVYGLQALPPEWTGTVYSDSKNALGRLFHGWKITNIPAWLLGRIGNLHRTHNLAGMTPVLLNGHPTRAELVAGMGKRGLPVSAQNVWCDNACRKEALRVRGEA